MIDEEQLLFVKDYVKGNGVTNGNLQDDLVDHFCCVIEEHMDEGSTFSDSFSIAVEKVAPTGPAEIQEDLNYLLTIKKQVMLRKVVYTLSYLATLQVIIGILFRFTMILDSNTALLLIMTGGLLFSVTAIPFFFYNKYLKSIRELQQG